jgi:hypothetical protein
MQSLGAVDTLVKLKGLTIDVTTTTVMERTSETLLGFFEVVDIGEFFETLEVVVLKTFGRSTFG